MTTFLGTLLGHIHTIMPKLLVNALDKLNQFVICKIINKWINNILLTIPITIITLK